MDLIGAIVVGVIFILTIWIMSSPFYWRGKGIPWVLPWPILGFFYQCTYMSFFEFTRDKYRELKGPMVGCHFFFKPALFLRHPDILKQVCVTDSESFMSRGVHADTDDFFDKSILLNGGEEWKTTRALMTPYFSPAKIKSMMPILQKSVDAFVKYIEQESSKGPLDVDQATLKLTSDMVASTSFGLEPDSFTNPDSIFYKLQAKFLGFLLGFKFMVSMFSLKLVKILGLTVFRKADSDTMKRLVKQVLEARIRGEGVRQDIMQGFTELYVKDKDSDKKDKFHPDGTRVAYFDLDNVTAQALTVLLAGIETTAHTLSYLFYELARNPDIQSRLRKEIIDVSSQKSGINGNDDIKQMTYLEMVINETLRMYSVVPSIQREATKTTKIGSLDVPKGTTCIVPIIGVHRSPEHYENPDKFNPERFAPGVTRPVGSFIPFGLGPRLCIGKKLAEIEMKLVIISLLMKFEVHTCSETPKVMRFGFGPSAAPRYGVPLVFKPISNSK